MVVRAQVEAGHISLFQVLRVAGDDARLLKAKSLANGNDSPRLHIRQSS